MKKNDLGGSGLMVSELCLGSMTWGTQNTADDAHEQIDRALDAGINFIDTAEMYPVNPISAETTGRTERIIGLWNERDGRRNDVVLATKHSGAGVAHIREGAPISSETIAETIEGSLRRLKTDWIDLYQFHWPNRGSYMFRKNWTYDPSGQDRADTMAHMEDTLGALQAEVKRGTIRHFGLSNESAWGMAQWAEAAKRTGGPKPISVQNEYSLMCRMADTDVAEACVNERIDMFAFSPLATGLLTGKYQGGNVPEGSRLSLNDDLGGRKGARAFEAVDAYLEVAKNHGLDPVHMALAWCCQRPFMGSVIFGATRMDQLETALGAADVTLSDEVLVALDEVNKAHPMPY
ncbi:aldo/keto reductase [Sulfitobacter geojensis]|uniref:Aldo/keto reductase n=1 Tax=Sulfitobacter geojensis TaxID=1342299 RepID=A0AAE3B5A8_9RHOB|nr:aldo/keto reductase [Sulfitobacter geojensis]MBM1688786.1 aldo/keto reductase [Sulfitobacter geojensis]MBM1692853.1 aldo/keto reductase [Sulfitobacter geojensis]MBM1705019.1 aldo/keto reductase [Sulfitobacter geojensis]MBM1709077.1 aldo/keto reductase [Sulfitobacter geojensis]MBM1713142.1 aldo/keto reductase [Sulfitobacter geojensis]